VPSSVTPETRGQLRYTREPSGEIRLALKLHKRSMYRTPPIRYDEYGMPEASPLVYSSKVGESCKSNAGHGVLPRETVFGSRGRRFVKSCCGALEKRYGKKCLFGTITLPGSTPQAVAMLAAWSAKAVELLRKWLAYHVPDCAFVWVWEWQKRGALHLHLALGSDKVGHLRRARKAFQGYVHTLFKTLSRLSETDMFEREHGGTWRGDVGALRSRLEDVKKSVKRYMAKYLSKGATANGAHYPSRWHGCNKQMRDLWALYRDCRVTSDANIGELATIFDIQLASWRETGWAVFDWREPYSSVNQTCIVYPPDDDADTVWEALCCLVSEAGTYWDARTYSTAT
jgi:hypothetical protein